jgi:hypothetical protein
MSTGKPRDRRKEQEWRQWLERWQRSGLSVAAFCRQQGLSAGRFHAWRRVLARRDAEQAAWVPVQVLAEPESVPDGTLEVVLARGRRLRLRRGVDAATLRQVLAVLEEEGAC